MVPDFGPGVGDPRGTRRSAKGLNELTASELTSPFAGEDSDELLLGVNWAAIGYIAVLLSELHPEGTFDVPSYIATFHHPI